MFNPIKKPYFYRAEHAADVYPNLGFDYRTKIYEKTLSKQVLADSENKSMLEEVQKLIYFLIEEVKTLKTKNIFALDKDSKLLN